jgi:hypothetical protein
MRLTILKDPFLNFRFDFRFVCFGNRKLQPASRDFHGSHLALPSLQERNLWQESNVLPAGLLQQLCLTKTLPKKFLPAAGAVPPPPGSVFNCLLPPATPNRINKNGKTVFIHYGFPVSFYFTTI